VVTQPEVSANAAASLPERFGVGIKLADEVVAW
jgi:hypothetical protein